MAGWLEGIRIALVLSLVLIAWAAIEQAHSVGPRFVVVMSYVNCGKWSDASAC